MTNTRADIQGTGVNAAQLSAATLRSGVMDLLGRAGSNAKLRRVEPCTLGGNNRIYRADTSDGAFAVKAYFRHAEDGRDRLASEYAFLTYANAAAPGSVPRQYACNPDAGMALYEFVEGRPFVAGQIGADEVDAATRFFRALNAPALRVGAQLPQASEACFCIADHLELIDGRITRLVDVLPLSSVDVAAYVLVQDISKLWQRLSDEIRNGAARVGLDCNAPLPAAQRCISPSDFGFHNALIEQNGNIRFLDFEYAGWDDPAKTAGDFFAQLAVPVPTAFIDDFTAEILRDFSQIHQPSVVARLLRPAYQIKWCCIALNVFLPVNLARRKFANPGLDEAALKHAQLYKAQQLFQSIQVTTNGLH
ncbi:MAG: hypothetical protein JWL63_510 [Rhodocyclales bacterium]|nr:hypothetical protein [Rhodocyclales bacterium]